MQGNLAVLPRDWAEEFLRFCQANPKPCPVLGIAEAGSPHVPLLGEMLNIRTDLPRYRVWRDGELAAEPRDLSPELAVERKPASLRLRQSAGSARDLDVQMKNSFRVNNDEDEEKDE